MSQLSRVSQSRAEVERRRTLAAVAELIGAEAAARLLTAPRIDPRKPRRSANPLPRPATPGNRISLMAHLHPCGG